MRRQRLSLVMTWVILLSVVGSGAIAEANGASPSSSEGTTMLGSDALAIEDHGLKPDVALTSSRFRPRVSFVLRRLANSLHGEETYWCPDPPTSERMIRLQWLYSCADALWLIRPFAVDCGTTDERPDATELADVIRFKLGEEQVHDIGDISAAPGLDLAAHAGRTLLITKTRATEHVVDPDPCRLLPEPGSDDPTITIGDDRDSLLMLMDVAGELVVLRASADYEGYGVENFYLGTFQDLHFID